MTDAELAALLADLESDRVERKESASAGGRIREAICAFANDLPDHQEPGVVFVGVKDDGECAGLDVTDELLQNLAHMRDDGNIVPFPSMTVQKRILSGCELAVVIVRPSDFPPVRYRGRVYVRVGPRRAIASPDEERRLAEKRRAGDIPFDMRPFSSAGIEDLDVGSFKDDYLPAAVSAEVLEQNQRDIVEQMASLRLVYSAETPVPTTLGILVLGKDPREFIPCDYIQFVRYDGRELADPIVDQKEIDGPLQQMLGELEDVLKLNIAVASDIVSGPTETQKPDYPIASLRQLAFNAVLHRTYEGTAAPVRLNWFSDRVEIQNPGGPYGQVNRENFGRPGVTDYRNPYLAEAMKNMGYVQRFGVGIPVARRELAKNDNPPLRFQVEEGHVLAIVRRVT